MSDDIKEPKEPEPPRLRVMKGTPWRIDPGRRAKWSARDFVSANAVDVRQIGVPLRIAIMDVDEAGIVAIEPTVEWTSEEKEETSEGCLSVRGLYGMLERPVAARIVADDLAGKRFTLMGDEFGAQCMLHETDHLNGILYVDRLKSREDLHTVEPDEEERVSA